ncbi:MAG TPA: signal peptidase I [Acidimicrobiia bacterium]|nr:signal peptidase I [Acidimicrobiia bacterium]
MTDERVETSADPHAHTSPDGALLEAPRAGATSDASVERHAKKGLNRTIIEWVVLVVAAIVIAVVIKTFLFQAFYIPSRSMVPTLEVGDRVLVNKLSYDLHDVHRGDIVVFSSGPNREWQRAGIDDLVKRVIALPGETLTQCQPERICIDGRLLDESYLPKGTVTDLYHGTQVNGQPTDHITGCAADSPLGGCTVPPGEYFVMGDNRAESSDARDHGPIKGSSIVGRVFVRIWPLTRIGFL